MKKLFTLIAFVPCLLCGEDWTPLLDSELSKWEIFMGVPHESVSVEDYVPKEGTDHMSGVAIGLGKDPLEVFRMIEVEGKPVLHISGQIYAGLSTKKEFENYHLRLDFKWGEKKWEPRLNAPRDSGLLFHCVGEHGAFWNVWLQSQEFQIQEKDCGDFIPLAGTSAHIPVGPYGYKNEKQAVYMPGGDLRSRTGYTQHGGSEEKPNGEWNTLELYTVGDSAVFVVNGTPNMALFDMQQRNLEGKGRVKSVKGRIQLQSEAAEIFYRNIEIRSIEEYPAELSEFTKRPEGDVEKWDGDKAEEVVAELRAKEKG
ncbi:MAG: 3-keto-disaccharide hydrolase [Roseibacillus sp.]